MGESDTDTMTRREFEEKILKAGWWALSLSALAGFASTAHFFFPKVLFEPPIRFTAGKPLDYRIGEVSEKYKASHQIWIVRDHEGIFALIARCTHLGCRPDWFSSQKRFRCPCHGSNFDHNGVTIAGPAPEPLRRALITLTNTGNILIDRSNTISFQDSQKLSGYKILNKDFENSRV